MITTISFISAIISIPSVFIPEKWRSKKIVFISFILLASILSGIIVNQNSKLKRIERTSQAAKELTESRQQNFTDKGFIQASLAFMEQNKDMYPESYQRAKEINETLKSSNYSSDASDAAYQMEGLLNGIAILNKVD